MTDPSPHPDRAAGRRTIFVVEPSFELRKLLAVALRHEGHEVLTAGLGHTARETCELHPGDVHLLLASDMPGDLGGFELAVLCRRRWPGLRVLHMTGVPHDPARHPGAAAVADHFIARPFSLVALVDRVRELLSSG